MAIIMQQTITCTKCAKDFSCSFYFHKKQILKHKNMERCPARYIYVSIYVYIYIYIYIFDWSKEKVKFKVKIKAKAKLCIKLDL